MYYLEGHIFNKTQREPPFMAHEAHSGLIDNLVEDHEVMVFSLVLRALEVVVQIIFKLGLLLIQIGKINEKSGTHIAFHSFDLFMRGRSVTST